MSKRLIKQQSQEKQYRTEPVYKYQYSGTGPFQYEPFNNIAHPIQPDDDDISKGDPTLRTINKSKLSQSYYQNNSGLISMRSNAPQSEFEESPFVITFPKKQFEFNRRRSKSKQIIYFLEKLMRKPKFDLQTKKYQYLFDQDENQNETYWVLIPSSLILKIWNIFFYLVLHFIIIYVPLSTTKFVTNINYFLIFLKIVDIIIQCSTSYSENGQFITKHYVILLRYIKTNLINDSLMITSFILLELLNEELCFIFVTILLITLMKRIFDLEISLKFEYHLFQPVIEFILGICKFIILIHIVTCYWLGLFGNDEIYLDHFYLVLSIYTFNSNFYPDQQQEQLFYSLITFSALLSFAYLITQTVNLFKYNRTNKQLSEFLYENKLNSNLKEKIISHILNQPKFYNSQFIGKLSGQLVEEFNYEQRSQLLIKYFKGYNRYSIQQLINKCEDIICQPNQIIVTESEYDDCSLYFIIEGTLKVVDKTGNTFQLLKPLETFGELSFYTSNPRQATIISEGVCRLLKIRRDVFLRILTFNDKQHFYNKKDRIIIHQELPTKCYCCQQTNHIIKKCPILTFKPDKEKIIKAYQFPKLNTRKEGKYYINKVIRRNNKDMKALEFYKDAEANQDYLLQLYSDNHFMSSNQISQSNLPYEDIYIKESQASAQSFTRISREKSLLKSTSLLKEKQSLHDQSIMNDVFFDQSEHQKQENDDDKFISLVRKDQQKNTFATAGFGNVGGQSIRDQKSLNIIVEGESSESQSLENVLEQASQTKNSSVKQVPVRNKEPKLTFNYNFDSQMNELQNKYSQYQRNASEFTSQMRQDIRQTSIRQNSSRSQTYSPLTSNNVTANSYRSIMVTQQTPSQIGRARKSTNSNNTLRSISGVNRQYTDSPDIQSKSRRETMRKKSTKTGTKISVAYSQFQPFSAFDNPIDTTFNDIEFFEKQYIFEIYFPHNNYDVVIQKLIQTLSKKKQMKRLSPYFLSFKQAKKIQQLKDSLKIDVIKQ